MREVKKYEFVFLPPLDKIVCCLFPPAPVAVDEPRETLFGRKIEQGKREEKARRRLRKTERKFNKKKGGRRKGQSRSRSFFFILALSLSLPLRPHSPHPLCSQTETRHSPFVPLLSAKIESNVIVCCSCCVRCGKAKK